MLDSSESLPVPLKKLLQAMRCELFIDHHRGAAVRGARRGKMNVLQGIRRYSRKNSSCRRRSLSPPRTSIDAHLRLLLPAASSWQRKNCLRPR